jgi:Fe-Mn family superoxide dismutase
LVVDGDDLKIITTADADTPVAHGVKPIFVIDLWEHAYYLDYQYRRAEFVEAVLDHLANWEFVASQLAGEVGAPPAG